MENNHRDTMENTRRPATDLGLMRTHLANERTFLAWLRTCLAIAAFGFLLEKMDMLIKGRDATDTGLLDTLGWLGHSAFLAAGLFLILAGWRFISVRKAIGQENAPFSTFPDIVVFIAATALLFMALLLTYGLFR